MAIINLILLSYKRNITLTAHCLLPPSPPLNTLGRKFRFYRLPSAVLLDLFFPVFSCESQVDYVILLKFFCFPTEETLPFWDFINLLRPVCVYKQILEDINS